MSTASIITNSATRAHGLAEGLLNGIAPDRAARFANGASGPINANHPTFVYGHLSIYNAMIVGMLGQDPTAAAAPDNYQDLFKHGVACLDDADGSRYPSLAEVVEHFKRGSDISIAAINAASDEQLDAPTPDENFRKSFPTVGDAANFLLNDHVMFHLGQVSTWRRAEGLGSAM